MGRNAEVKDLIEVKDEHWIWQGAKIAEGYGGYSINGVQYYAHEIIYRFFYGDWPNITCHKCEYKKCIWPEHIYSGTYKTNNNDSIEKRSFKDFQLTLKILYLRQQGLSYRAIEKEIQRRLSYVMIGIICRRQKT